jgi:hypothetical protein
MSEPRWIALSTLTLSLALFVAVDASAQTRTEVLRWEDDFNTDLVGYRVHFGTASRVYTDVVEVGIPAKVDGAFQASVEVDADADIYFAVTAYNADAESYYSNERCRSASGDCVEEPPPPPPPPSDGPQAAVVGFALWDASSGSVIDSSFQSGEQIDAASQSCVAIEILGNSYLDADGPGSIKKVFDGQDIGCNNPGVSHENSAPFAWEADGGPGVFECAATLTQVGQHRLTITPYDGDNCSGAEGSPVTLLFEVIDSGSQPAPLGAPGQPQAVIPSQ